MEGSRDPKLELRDVDVHLSVATVMTACVLGLSSILAVLSALGVVIGVMVSLLASQPGQSPIFLAVMSAGTLGSISAFFVMVSMRLFAALRGRAVKHLMPPWLAVALALVLGLGGIAATAISAGHRSYSGLGASITFLAFSLGTIWRWILRKKRPSIPPPPSL
ncbi:MAG: hypothetical protein ABI551_13130 [Polyangiaceae bacterium]